MYSVVIFISVPTVPAPQSVTLTSSDNVGISGSSITLNCTVELDPSVIWESELSLLIVEAQLSRNGTPLTMLSLSGPTVTGTTFTFGAEVSSFNESDVGNYTCLATVTPQASSTYLTGTRQLQSSPLEISK